jgi:hypothetical protein
MTVSEVEQFLFDADTETLNRVSEVIAIRRGHLRDRMKRDFQVGDTVSFPGRKRGEWRGTLTGTLVKKNPKKAKVEVPHPKFGYNVSWTVPYTMLTPEG